MRSISVKHEIFDNVNTCFLVRKDSKIISYSSESVFGLVFLCSLRRVIHQGKSSGFSTTEITSETEKEALRSGGLVHLANLLLELSFANVGTARVDHVNDLLKNRE